MFLLSYFLINLDFFDTWRLDGTCHSFPLPERKAGTPPSNFASHSFLAQLECLLTGIVILPLVCTLLMLLTQLPVLLVAVMLLTLIMRVPLFASTRHDFVKDFGCRRTKGFVSRRMMLCFYHYFFLEFIQMI